MATTTSRHWWHTPAHATTSRQDGHLSELDSTRRRISARRSGTNADHLSSPASSPANGDRSAEASGETFAFLSAEGRADPLDEVRRRRHGTIANRRNPSRQAPGSQCFPLPPPPLLGSSNLLGFSRRFESKMYLQYYINEKGDKVYTTKKESPLGVPTQSAHPARFSPDDKYSRQRYLLKKRFGLLPTQKPAPKY
ncbi:hypothetical protein GUJ93_ZPchr0006g46427 [Zizania palustris]|uniref:Nucleolar protein 10 n=1 Tax=Zizania palustris TaxID=103762 RepID=A0A8J5SZV1_ZIZPA|nr:hypothetical protein GUJ93_ZPchr0006g46427 [Zizania palustris]